MGIEKHPGGRGLYALNIFGNRSNNNNRNTNTITNTRESDNLSYLWK
jgi:hypothetical protein